MTRILYFAWLREKIGVAEEILDLPPELATVAQLIGWLRGRDARHDAAFADDAVLRCAVDQEISERTTSIAGAQEIAFFPPVTGG